MLEQELLGHSQRTNLVDSESKMQAIIQWAVENNIPETHIPRIHNALLTKKYMSLEWQNLNYLIPEIGLLPNLVDLDLYHNNITILPDEIGDITTLQHLGLCYNQLIKLPDSLNKLVRLKKLRISGNPITSLSNVAELLSRLDTLQVSDNQVALLKGLVSDKTTVVIMDDVCTTTVQLGEVTGRP
jgi:Leucine-rich repeat (LRR) protein